MFNEELNIVIDGLTHSLSLSELEKERSALSSHYRDLRHKDKKVNALTSHHQRLAYLAARVPATYAAVVQVLKRAQARGGEAVPASLLDVGAGPGTALWAALDVFPMLKRATLLERDSGFISLGKTIANALQEIDLEWVRGDILSAWEVEPADLVIASYSLGELAEMQQADVLKKLWQMTQQTLVIVEPGTPLGFSQILFMRNCLLAEGAHLLAPCPHTAACPVKEGDWCHFSARIERSSLHRKIKGGILNYEDEKYSYLIFSREVREKCHARVVRHPYYGSGFVKLKICSDAGLEEKTITKKNKESYLYSRKLKWGDGLK